MLDSIELCIIGFCFGFMMYHFAVIFWLCVDATFFVNIYLSGTLFVYWFTSLQILQWSHVNTTTNRPNQLGCTKGFLNTKTTTLPFAWVKLKLILLFNGLVALSVSEVELNLQNLPIQTCRLGERNM